MRAGSQRALHCFDEEGLAAEAPVLSREIARKVMKLENRRLKTGMNGTRGGTRVQRPLLRDIRCMSVNLQDENQG